MNQLIKFSTLNPQIANVLKMNNIKETQLKNRYSDLYIECYDNVQQGNVYKDLLKLNIISRDMLLQYRSQSGSGYYIVEIGLAAMDHYVQQKLAKRSRPIF